MLSVHLLGGFHVTWNEKPITAFESNKVRALLAYLAVEAGKTHQRSSLAGLLWPDSSERAARTNLRHTLHQLRQTLPDIADSPPRLVTTKQSIQFSTSDQTVVDVQRFEQLLVTCRQCTHAALDACAACMERYTQAAHLYQGDLLADLSLQDSDLFSEWLVVQRERLHRQAFDILFTLTHLHERYGDFDSAQKYATRQLDLEPWREEAHRQLMRILAYQGQRSAALAQFGRCREILANELGVEPDAETVALHAQIRTGSLANPTTTQQSVVSVAATDGEVKEDAASSPALHPLMTARRADWGEAPAHSAFYGRQSEVETLLRWIVQRRCRVIAVLGMGGMGKTSLVAKVAKAASEHFELVFWRSLLNAPPLADLLHPLLQLLLPSGEVQLPTTLGEQLTLLFTQLRQQRCLLILDNLESILDAGEAGRYRPGYEAYGQLLQRAGNGDHQSCLLLTSRERPEGVGRMEDDLPLVRSLRLDGLETEAGRMLLKERGLDDDLGRAARLVERYSGNPLALKLITRTIQDLFDGDISTFLNDEALIFDDIRNVLDQQFGRLTPLEQELLIWLAVEREAVSTDTLAQNLVRTASRRALIEALRALQRRSLLERNNQGFVLQNVVSEYLTDFLIEKVCQEIGSCNLPEMSSTTSHTPLHQDSINHTNHETTQRQSNMMQLHLNRHALFKAHAKEYIRQSQLRLIVHPIVTHVRAQLGRSALIARLGDMRRTLQERSAGQAADAPGYLGGNLLNLLLYLGVDLSGADFSHLCLWQAFLRGKMAPDLNLSGADLTGAAFTYVFGNVQSLQFQADNELLVVGTSGETACVWQAKDGALLYTVPVQDPTYSFIRFHAASRVAALGGPDFTLVLMQMESGRRLHTLTGHAAPIWCRIFSPKGEWLASGDADGTVYLWDVTHGEALGCLSSHDAPITALAFAPDGNLLASGDVDGVVSLWRAPSGELIRSFKAHADEVGALQFVLGGAAIASGSHDRTICLWELVSGDLLRQLNGHTQPIRMMGADTAGETLISGGEDHFIAVWDIKSGQTRYRLSEHAAPLWHLGCRSDGLRVAALDTSETVGVWDLETGQRTEVYPIHHNGIETLAFSPDGKLLASGGTDGIVYLWDIRVPTSPILRTRLQGHTRRVKSIVFSADGTTLASGDRRGELRLWSIESGVSRVLQSAQEGIMALAFHPAGQVLVSAGADGTLHLWQVATGQPYKDFVGHTNAITACSFSPDGRRLVSCGFDRTVRLWDVEKGVELFTMKAHTSSVQHVAFCPDGERIISSSYDETICLWNAADGQLLTRWSAPNLAYISLDVHPAGDLVAAGSHDNAIHLLALETGQLVGELSGHTRSVETLHFSPVAVAGMQLLASAGFDETIRLWVVESRSAATEASLNAARCLATMRAPGPYSGMNISGVTGISPAQKTALRALGAIEAP